MILKDKRGVVIVPEQSDASLLELIRDAGLSVSTSFDAAVSDCLFALVDLAADREQAISFMQQRNIHAPSLPMLVLVSGDCSIQIRLAWQHGACDVLDGGAMTQQRFDFAVARERNRPGLIPDQFASVVLDNIPNMIFVKDAAGKILYCSKSYADQHHIDRSRLLGHLTAEYSGDWDEEARWRDEGIDLIKSPGKILEKEYGYRFTDSAEKTCHVARRALESDTCHMSAVLGVATDVTRLHNQKIKVERESKVDPLTGLYNRRFLKSHILDLARESSGRTTKFALVLLDLDGFKAVNDTHGHLIGDRLLFLVAMRLRGVVRQRDVVGRIGGDEFMVVVKEDTNRLPVSTLVQRITDRLKMPFFVNGMKLSISCSVGVSRYPEQGRCFEQLYKNSDQAMYRAKRNKHQPAQKAVMTAV